MQEATLRSPAAEQRLIVESIGSASPGLAGVLASQLGMPASQVASALYKAPAILLDKLPMPHAQGLAEILSQAGLGIRIEPSQSPVPTAADSLDIALYLREPACLATCCERLSRFLGCPAAAIQNMLLAPPSVILGDVSQATADALQQLLDGLPVELICSARKQARYALFISRQRGTALSSLLGDLQRMGINADATGTLDGAELDYQQGQYLWRRHQSAGGLRLVDKAFMRFDLNLEQISSDSCLEQLPALAGFPADLVPCVIENLPIVVEEGVPAHSLQHRLAAWSAAGMTVRPQLASLRCCRLIVESCPQPERCRELLQTGGLIEHAGQLATLPWISDMLFGELLPRWLQSGLDALEAEYRFEETSP
ncbi:hypothetical protein [Halopseudomonas salina]|uniref:Uncharacterized protein n=1 Tax=Halopseudomonas salina TaxID=1323744 RepID=A0ABQ1PD31_9GAMM|nr:hypothetical protein [Halopseudomonas salina]GGC94891.1 hypothetical protein GCM10007418_13100 [Halopseudomonas salina]